MYLGPSLPHLADEYDNPKIKARKDFDEAKAKEQENPFYQKVRSMPHFVTIKEAYGEDVPLPHKKPPVVEKPAVTHDVPFKPCAKPPRQGYNCTLSKHPEYKPCPPKEFKRKVRMETDPDEPPAFKMTHKHKSRP